MMIRLNSLTMALFCVFLVAIAHRHGSAEEEARPAFSEIQRTIEMHFQTSRGYHPNDIISRSQVADVLRLLDELGWKVPHDGDILSDVLEDQHVLVSTLRTPAGRRFMSKVSKRELIYDRLDRVASVSGGPQLIQDLVKLPDGEKYAKPRSGGGVPDLLDLLPKNASGKTRRITDYHKPTGHIYTVSALVERLKEAYHEPQQKSGGAQP